MSSVCLCSTYVLLRLTSVHACVQARVREELRGAGLVAAPGGAPPRPLDYTGLQSLLACHTELLSGVCLASQQTMLFSPSAELLPCIGLLP